jgi:hypothetical protein
MINLLQVGGVVKDMGADFSDKSRQLISWRGLTNWRELAFIERV